MPARRTMVRTRKAMRMGGTSTAWYRGRPMGRSASMRSWKGRRRAGRSGPKPNGGSGWRSDWSVLVSGFTVVVFMALAWLRGAGQHIGKIPGASLISRRRHQGRVGVVPDSQFRVRGAMMGCVKQTARWDHDPFTHGHRGPFGLRRRGGNGGPLRRDPADRLGGGVASGVAAWKGFNATTVRIVFVLIALISGGWCVPLYVVAWLLIPAAGADSSIGSKARSDTRGLPLAGGLASLLVLVLRLAGALNDGWFISWAWPQVFSVVGLVLIWRNAPADEQATLRHLVEPLGAAAGATAREGGPGGGRGTAPRPSTAGPVPLGGVGWPFSWHQSPALH